MLLHGRLNCLILASAKQKYSHMSNSGRSSAFIDVVNTFTGVVLCHFHYSPYVSGDHESARKLATHFVHDYCLRHKLLLSSFEFVDHYRCSRWILD